MKRHCSCCNKTHVTSRSNFRDKKAIADHPGDESLCDSCFKDVKQINRDQSYWGSFEEWDAPSSNYY